MKGGRGRRGGRDKAWEKEERERMNRQQSIARSRGISEGQEAGV